MQTINDKKPEEDLSPYTDKKPEEVFDEHEEQEEGYKSPYVTEEPVLDKSEAEIDSPYTEPDAQKPENVPGGGESPYTEKDTP